MKTPVTPVTSPLTETAPQQGGTLGRCHVRVVEGPERGSSVEIGFEPVLVGTAEEAKLRLSDPRVSRRHLQLQAGTDAVLLKDMASRNGTWFEGSRVREIALPPGALVRVGDSWLQLVSVERSMGPAPSSKTNFGGLEGKSRSMRQVFTFLERAAATDSTVLLQGATGTGKELAARSLHEASARAKNDFVVVDCSAITPSLLHAALFGHGSGAFTGAVDAKKGALELAHQGTLFIDEVAGIPLELQPLLLRFLDRSELQPLGTGSVVKVDVRVVAATREELPGLVAKGLFREDLFYRLNVVTVDLPPLRARLEDMQQLVTSILTRLGVTQPGPVEGDNLARLLTHPWPGNVRELENVLRRALTLAGRPRPFLELDLSFDSATLGTKRDPTASFQEQKEQVVEQFEREFLAELLQKANGSIKLASRLSGIERMQLKRLLKKRGLL
jgi:transcriptional regulator with PAS, ATPase and Fis domain